MSFRDRIARRAGDSHADSLEREPSADRVMVSDTGHSAVSIFDGVQYAGVPRLSR